MTVNISTEEYAVIFGCIYDLFSCEYHGGSRRLLVTYSTTVRLYVLNIIYQTLKVTDFIA
ncbi:hypothetical protein VCHA53O466_140121 [Vibrio chagasii]|nr:hypothetical protein VCHA53O466_140121 [Vibrio chagasii]